MEKEKRFKFTDSKSGVTVSLLIMSMILLLSYFFNIYPGGYSFEADNNKVIVEKGLLRTEVLNVEVSENNELKIALLFNKINELKWKWFYYIILFTLQLLLILKVLRPRYGKTPALTLIIILTVLFCVSYIYTIYNIEHLISLL